MANINARADTETKMENKNILITDLICESENETIIKVHNLTEKVTEKIHQPFELSECKHQKKVMCPKYTKDFVNPFKCVVKSISLQLLDEQAKMGVKKKLLPNMTTNEVIVHNTPDDCWVIIFGVVRDLTPLIEEYKRANKYDLVKPIVAHAGKDISHWFNESTNDILHFVHPITGVSVPYTPHGRIPDVGLQVPSTNWKLQTRLPWWQDNKYIVGLLTKSTRPIRIMNTLSRQEVLLHVCCEDTLNRIQQRYIPFNKHATSYTWKYEGKILDMALTLDENGIKDERKFFSEIGLCHSVYVPCIMLYFNDDLTEF